MHTSTVHAGSKNASQLLTRKFSRARARAALHPLYSNTSFLWGIVSQESLVRLYSYIHLFPPASLMSNTLGFCKRTRTRQVNPCMHVLSALGDGLFIDPLVRFEHNNHHLFFPVQVTSAVDTVPVYVADSWSKSLAKTLFNGKHSRVALSFEFWVDFRGRLLGCFGPQLPTVGDGQFFSHTIAPLCQPWELVLGDSGFAGQEHVRACARCGAARLLALSGEIHDR